MNKDKIKEKILKELKKFGVEIGFDMAGYEKSIDLTIQECEKYYVPQLEDLKRYETERVKKVKQERDKLWVEKIGKFKARELNPEEVIRQDDILIRREYWEELKKEMSNETKRVFEEDI